MKLLVSMGLSPDAVRGKYRRAALRKIDWDNQSVTEQLDWSADDGAYVGAGEDCEFTSGCLSGATLLQSTRSEVLWIDARTLTVVERFSHPLFYDIHSVVPRREGGFIVTSTGNESVLEFDDQHQLVRHWFVRDSLFEEEYPGVDDFRTLSFEHYKNQSTRSGHSHHPNFAVYVGQELWVTLFETLECRSLTEATRRIPLPEGPPHDGCLREGLLWFTTTNGHIIAVDPLTLQRQFHLDLGPQLRRRELYGWCRGIEVVGQRCWVGLTTLRSSRLRGWLRKMLKGEDWRKSPTSVVEVDLERGEIVATMVVGREVGDTLFGVHCLPGAA